mmetsp:Transcript_5570/g.9811  ORF Transcript_5570/g.9811 Transcript_5570/m.9811 type:complete len:86 (+) Transcript_5570:262-519(+)
MNYKPDAQNDTMRRTWQRVRGNLCFIWKFFVAHPSGAVTILDTLSCLLFFLRRKSRQQGFWGCESSKKKKKVRVEYVRLHSSQSL